MGIQQQSIPQANVFSACELIVSTFQRSEDWTARRIAEHVVTYCTEEYPSLEGASADDILEDVSDWRGNHLKAFMDRKYGGTNKREHIGPWAKGLAR